MAKFSRQCQTCSYLFCGLIGVTKIQKCQGSKTLKHYFAIEASKNTVAIIVMCSA